ncbi:MAG: LOG family protein [Gemmataceae bacterium]
MDHENTSVSRPDLVSLSDEDGVKKILFSTVLELWDVVNNLTRLQPSRRERYHVTIFGSARTEPDAPIYNEVKRLASKLAEMGCDIITGGGPGLMQAANEGARSVGAGERNRSVGIRIDLPFEEGANPFVQHVFSHKTFFTRLHHFIIASDAFVVVPGGIGTTLETMMVWQLLQVRHLYRTPLVMVGQMWRDLVEWATQYMIEGNTELANKKDMDIPRCVDNVDEAVTILKEHHDQWLKQESSAL